MTFVTQENITDQVLEVFEKPPTQDCAKSCNLW